MNSVAGLIYQTGSAEKEFKEAGANSLPSNR
jgi:hypothetical protein